MVNSSFVGHSRVWVAVNPNMFSFKEGELTRAWDRRAAGRPRLGADDLLQVLRDVRELPVPRARLDLLLQDFDGGGNGTLSLAELKQLNAYLNRGHNVQAELRNVYELVESQAMEIATLRSRLVDADASARSAARSAVSAISTRISGNPSVSAPSSPAPGMKEDNAAASLGVDARHDAISAPPPPMPSVPGILPELDAPR